jgi:hypothetical protein
MTTSLSRFTSNASSLKRSFEDVSSVYTAYVTSESGVRRATTSIERNLVEKVQSLVHVLD